jgi:glyoxylase-like metal-dependent hydrolase (beta-lactamase superfamily II)
MESYRKVMHYRTSYRYEVYPGGVCSGSGQNLIFLRIQLCAPMVCYSVGGVKNTKIIMKIYAVHITNFKIDGGAMFGVIPKALWQRVTPADENNLCNWAIRSLLIDTGSRVIFVDNGYGDKQDDKYFRHVYLNGGDGLVGGLAKAGYRPEDVTDMVLTHLHADHCGGGVRRSVGGAGYELVFPNADYIVSRRQWEAAINPNLREVDSYPTENLLPMLESGRLRLLEEPGQLCEGVELQMVSGHTQGQIIPVVDLGGRKLVFAADLIPSTAHIPLLWNMSYDLDQLLTISEKSALLEEAVDNGDVLMFQHDFETECCTVVRTPKGVRVGERMRVVDL